MAADSKSDTPLQRNIRKILELRGESAREASLAVGTNDSLVKAILDGRSSNPRSDTIQKLADHWGITHGELMDPAANLHGVSKKNPRTPTRNFTSAATAHVENERFPVPTMTQDVEVIGTAAGGDGKGDFQLNGQVVERVRRPPGLIGAMGVFALRVTGDSMSPRYDEGELVFVHPGRPVTPGCYVLIELNGKHDHEPGSALIKRLLRRTKEKLVLAQLNPEKELTLPTSQVKHIYRILNSAELFGV